MIIVMQAGAPKADLEAVLRRIRDLGYRPHVIHGVERNVIGAIGDERGKASLQQIESMTGVEKVVPILVPYKLAGLELHREPTVVDAGGVKIGGGHFAVMAGPCSIESADQLLETARGVHEAGAHILRGGAFKPRTSPYAFQGLGKKGLKLLAEARQATGMPVVTEVVNPQDVTLVEEYADVIQVGARNVQNFALLKKLGRVKKPILLKRGMMTGIEEFLMAAEYILSEGNKQVILCERGIRTFETATRNTLDLSAVPVIKTRSHLPIIVDPSHATGHWKYVESMCLAAAAAGADGLMVEVHIRPKEALSDGLQSLTVEHFGRLMRKLAIILEARNRAEKVQ
jgi:3-deoxy-7-phosphoheptulonate synthase